MGAFIFNDFVGKLEVIGVYLERRERGERKKENIFFNFLVEGENINNHCINSFF